jgi:hypothetical protein
MSDYIHDVPGRLRVKIAEIKKNPSVGIQIHELLEKIPGTTSLSIRSTTGSVIVTYNPQILNPDRILSILAANDFITVNKLVRMNSQLDAVVHKAIEVVLKAALSRALSKALGGSPLSAITTLF